MADAKPVLIFSESLDYHGVAVRWALEHLGVPVEWWDRTTFPSQQCLSARTSGTHRALTSTHSPVSFQENRYRSIWNRRGQVPTVSKTLDRTDQTVARNEANFTLQGIQQTIVALNPAALVVNAFDAAKSANPKGYQIFIASQVGFQVPETLISNDPEAVRRFFAECDGDVVAKQHIPFAWRTPERELLVLGTTAVAKEHLRSDEALRGSPLIYQRRLRYASEIRLTVFGRSFFGLRITKTASASGSGFVDIRYEPVNSRPFVAPEGLATLCLKYMSAMNLNYAAFDIAEMDDGSYVFIEANESGQFLFLEHEASEIPLLDAFCQFLETADPQFEYQRRRFPDLAKFDETEEAKQFHERYNHHMKTSELTSPFELVEQ